MTYVECMRHCNHENSHGTDVQLCQLIIHKYIIIGMFDIIILIVIITTSRSPVLVWTIKNIIIGIFDIIILIVITTSRSPVLVWTIKKMVHAWGSYFREDKVLYIFIEGLKCIKI